MRTLLRPFTIVMGGGCRVRRPPNRDVTRVDGRGDPRMQQKLPQGKPHGICLRQGAWASPIEAVALGIVVGIGYWLAARLSLLSGDPNRRRGGVLAGSGYRLGCPDRTWTQGTMAGGRRRDGCHDCGQPAGRSQSCNCHCVCILQCGRSAVRSVADRTALRVRFQFR